MEWISKLVTPRGSEGDGEAKPAPATDDDRLAAPRTAAGA